MRFSLEALIIESGLRKNYIAECLGISEQSFCNKLKNRRRFRDAEITKLSQTLMVSERIIRRTLS